MQISYVIYENYPVIMESKLLVSFPIEKIHKLFFKIYVYLNIADVRSFVQRNLVL